MAGFQIDMSPLERSSRVVGQSLVDIGQNVGSAIQKSRQRSIQEQEQGDVEAFMRQAMSGDPTAFKELMVKSPQAANQVAQYLQQQQATQQAGDEKLAGERLLANQNTVEKLYRIQTMPEQERDAAIQELVNSPFDDFDETDVPFLKDPRNLQAAAVKYFGADDAKARFGIGKEEEGFTLGKDEVRYDQAGNVVASAPTSLGQPVEIPPVLLEGLSPNLGTQASAAYTAAGGGKDGMIAYQKQVDKGTEQERRLVSPQILADSFPKASPAEMAQLQGAMDGAKTTESGLKAANKVREEQRRLVKAKGFQERAIDLLGGILDNPELDDVLGSVEGAIDFRFQDSEAELIADIEEAGNILTADNLSLMSGVLSESDIKILKNLAGGGLIRTRSSDRFKKDVKKLLDKLSSQMVVTIGDRGITNQPSAGNAGVPDTLSDSAKKYL